jgi:hypothetical protein
MPLVHVASEAAAGAAHRIEHATGILAAFEFDGDGVAMVAQCGRCELRHAGGGVVEGPACVGRPNRSSGWMRSQMPAPMGRLYFLQLAPERASSSPRLSPDFLSEVVHLRKSFVRS